MAYKEIYLAGGCFWGLEYYMSLLRGVKQTEVGYANGHTPPPTYEQVCRGDTGYAETVRVTYDPGEISLASLLDAYYEAIDPTSLNRQGGDAGPQYRTGIYYTGNAEKEEIEASLRALQERYPGKPVQVECAPLQNYFPAEEYHQKYLWKNPAGYCHISFETLKKEKNWGGSPEVM